MTHRQSVSGDAADGAVALHWAWELLGSAAHSRLLLIPFPFPRKDRPVVRYRAVISCPSSFNQCGSGYGKVPTPYRPKYSKKSNLSGRTVDLPSPNHPGCPHNGPPAGGPYFSVRQSPISAAWYCVVLAASCRFHSSVPANRRRATALRVWAHH
jgi:hypothetical protein